MRGILILAHGSKIHRNEGILDFIVEKVKSKTGENLVCPAYLQFSEERIENGIQRLVNLGADEILIIPLFIFNGILVERDIPNELNNIKKKYPNLIIKVSKHIGDDDKLADIIVDRIYSI